MGTFEELYERHVQAVFRFAMSVTGRREAAEDLTSEAFLALHRNLDAIDQAQLPGWLLTVVRNRARDLWRRRVVEQRYLESLAEAPQSEPPAMESWILESADLKPIHRTCLMLRYVCGMTRAEIEQDRSERDADQGTSAVWAVAAASGVRAQERT